MGFREWDEVAWFDRVSDWLSAHRGVYLVVVSGIGLSVYGIDFAETSVAIRTWILLGALLVGMLMSMAQLVRARRHRPTISDDVSGPGSPDSGDGSIT